MKSQMQNGLNPHEGTQLQNTASEKEHNLELVELEERLHKCTNLNSHKVRGPIARVLGLVELSRLDKEIDYEWFFLQIKHEVRHIDRIIKRVSRELERIEDIKKLRERQSPELTARE